jgi:HD-GYP domain-containing protein (c-di-GMP phosphodiesterase class II)
MSIATDLGLGKPLETGMTICLRSMRLAEAMGVSADELARTYSLAMLRHIGCTVGSDEIAAVARDEHEFMRTFATVDFARQAQVITKMLGLLRRQFRGAAFPPALARMIASLPKLGSMGVARCEVAQMLAERLGFGPDLLQDLLLFGERWDGKSEARKAKGEDLTPSVRAVQLAEGITILSMLSGQEEVDAIVRERRASVYAPDAVDAYLQDPGSVLAASDVPSVWDAVMDAEPQQHAIVGGERLDDAMSALADFADLKSSYLVGHSAGVAALARSAAEQAGLPPADVAQIYRAALAHDVGRVGVSTSIWNKAGPLTTDQWEKVRMHAYYTDRVLARPEALHAVGTLASMHHERMDSSGYFRAFDAGRLPAGARILAAADVFHAMLEARPHRPARTKEQAAEELLAEVRAGRIDADAADAVLKAAGRPVPRRRRDPGALTSREAEVIRLLARGLSIKQIARALTISPKTADAHIQHIYTKIGVTTRAAATVYAMNHDLADVLD